MKTSEQAMAEVERVLETAEKAAPEYARELVNIAHAWMTLADRLQEREYKAARAGGRAF